MAKTRSASVDDYFAAQPPAIRKVLARVRRTIRDAVPGAEETMSYQMPAFKLHGRVVLYFAGWKEHYAVYPAIGGLQQAFAKELARYEVSKGTIRFPLSEPVPVRLIARIARFRARAVAERMKTKEAGSKKRAAGRLS